MSGVNTPFGAIKEALKRDRRNVVSDNRQYAIKNLKEVLIYVEGMLDGLETQDEEYHESADGGDGDERDAASENTNEDACTDTASPETTQTSFRDKDMANQLSYAILAYMRLKSNQPLSLKKISTTVERIFGFTNSASINTKLNRWKEEGYMQWPHPDRRKITSKGISLIADYEDLIEPARKAEIDRLLEDV